MKVHVEQRHNASLTENWKSVIGCNGDRYWQKQEWKVRSSFLTDYVIKVLLLGEILIDKSKVEQIVRRVLKQVGFTSDEVGFDADICQVIINVHGQSSEIADAVHTKKDELDMGSGDQGLICKLAVRGDGSS